MWVMDIANVVKDIKAETNLNGWESASLILQIKEHFKNDACVRFPFGGLRSVKFWTWLCSPFNNPIKYMMYLKLK